MTNVEICDHYWHTDGTCLRCGAVENAMGDKTRGIYQKFNVRRTDLSDQSGGKHEGCFYFVLDCDHDPHARAALKAYEDSCRLEYPALAEDLSSILSTRSFGQGKSEKP